MNNRDLSAMSEPNNKGETLVPRLRFPGFLEPWKYTDIGDKLHEVSITVPGNTTLPVFSSTRSGLKPQKDYFDGKELINEGEYGVVPDGHFVYRHMSDDGTFKFNINKTGMRIAVSKEYPVFTTVRLHPEFLLHLLNEGEGFARFALKQKKGGTRTRLYFKTLCSWAPALPTYDEQEKIAECLSSLDELIAARAQKLGTLKDYKTGLMQKLFPRDGEVAPRLRFPEFGKAPKWEKKRLEDLANRGSGHTPSKSNPEYYNGGIKWVSLADSRRLDNGFISETEIEISEQGIRNSSAVLHPAGTVILSRDAGVGKSAVMRTPMAVSQHFMAWTCNADQLSNWFLYYSLQKSKPLFERVANGNTIKTIGLPFFVEMHITLPSLAEQEKIADCLLSVDNLITIQAREIDALKRHKKSLMQKLFPAMDEVLV